MKLVVVVVCYKVVDLTIDCLRTLALEVDRLPGGARVLVVENGTGGDAPDRLARAIAGNGWDRWCELTAIHPNLGFTGGNNVALRQCLAWDDPPDYVMLLNADTLLLGDSLAPLVAFMDGHPAAGIAGSQCLAPTDPPEPNMSYGRFQRVAFELDRGLKLGVVTRLLRPWIGLGPLDSAQPVDWVPGAAMIIRREVLEQIGLLDEGLYTYYDDLDFCLRARRAGWPTWFVPQSRLIHIEGASTGVTAKRVKPKRRPPYWFEARRRYLLKSHGPATAALADAAFILGYALYRLRRPIQGKPDDDPPHLLADSIRQSVFLKGFRVQEVENPALREAAAPAAVGAAGGVS